MREKAQVIIVENQEEAEIIKIQNTALIVPQMKILVLEVEALRVVKVRVRKSDQ